MATQSINLGTTTAATFNGTTVNKINLNGSQIWAAPITCATYAAATPFSTNMTNWINVKGSQDGTPDYVQNIYKTTQFPGELVCGSPINVRITLPSLPYTLFTHTLTLYDGSTALSVQSMVTGWAEIVNTFTIPAGSKITSIKWHLFHPGNSYWTSPDLTISATITLWS
jgi:hypothetical protein